MRQAFADPGVRILRARRAKAEALARMLVAHGFTPQLVAMMGPEEWETVARCAHVPPPGSEYTIQLVMEMVEGRR